MPPTGLLQLCAGINPVVDIVAVHGINGDALRTWTAEGRSLPWIQDILPGVTPNARILTWGYDANISSLFGPTSSDRILQHAHTLVSQLHADRSISGATERPIIFLCHSLGGIIVKKALAYSASRVSKSVEHLHAVYTCTYGIIFFGTPHHGSHLAKMASFLQRVIKTTVPSRIVDTDRQLLNALQHGSEVLHDISDQFAPLMKKFRIFFFWEQQKTKLPHKWEYIVDQSSAAPIFDSTERAGINADHRQMCRFAHTSDAGFRVVAEALLRYSRDAQTIVRTRVTNSRETMKRQRLQDAWELAGEK